MFVELIRRKQKTATNKENTEKPKLQRREKPKLQRRIKSKLVRRTKPKLQRREKPDVYYCEKKIKNRLPYPIECFWVGSMYSCCRRCTKKIVYGKWREGGYSAIAKKLENRTYTEADTEEENPTNFTQEDEG